MSADCKLMKEILQMLQFHKLISKTTKLSILHDTKLSPSSNQAVTTKPHKLEEHPTAATPTLKGISVVMVNPWVM